MEKAVPNSKFVGHSTEIFQQSKIKGPLTDSSYYEIFCFSILFLKRNHSYKIEIFLLCHSKFYKSFIKHKLAVSSSL